MDVTDLDAAVRRGRVEFLALLREKLVEARQKRLKRF
jgi:hypothetical protein